MNDIFLFPSLVFMPPFFLFLFLFLAFTWAEQPASAAILLPVLALVSSIGSAIASTRICLSHDGNAICQQVSRHFFLSAHRTSPPTRTHSSVFFLNPSSDFLLQAIITSPSLYFITTPDFKATSQSLEIC